MNLRTALGGGDRRSLGRAGEVVVEVLVNPHRLAELLHCLADSDPRVRMRAADAAEKIAALHPDWFAGHATDLLALAETATQQELRWHLAQILPRLALKGADRNRAIAVMRAYLADQSRIVRVNALTALADFSSGGAGADRDVRAPLEEALSDPAPAVRARARLLLRRMP